MADIILTPAVITLVVTNIALLARDGLKYLAKRRNNGPEAKAGAGQVSVNVGGSVGAGVGNGSRGSEGQQKPMTPEERKLLMDHNRELGQHEEKINTLSNTFNLYHRENREDHQKLFDAIERINSL